jgi:hypothetical protein
MSADVASPLETSLAGDESSPTDALLPTLPPSISPSRRSSGSSAPEHEEIEGLSRRQNGGAGENPTGSTGGVDTRAAQLEAEARAQQAALEREAEEERRANAARQARWRQMKVPYLLALHMPSIIFLMALLHFALQPMAMRHYVVSRIGDIYAPLAGKARNVSSSLSLFGGDGADATTLLYPRTLEQSWKLGQVEQKVREQGCLPSSWFGSPATEDETDKAVSDKCPQLLQEAAMVLTTAPLSHDQNNSSTTSAVSAVKPLKWSQILKAKEAARKLDVRNAKGGLVSRALGFLTFARVMWFFAIVTMLSTAVPALYVLLEITGLKHLIALFGGRLFAFIKLLVVKLATLVVKVFITNPIARLLHQPVALLMSYLLFVHALSYYQLPSQPQGKLSPSLNDDQEASLNSEARKSALSMALAFAAIVACFVITSFPNPPLELFTGAPTPRSATNRYRPYSSSYGEDEVISRRSLSKGRISSSLYCSLTVLVAAYLGQTTFPHSYISVLLSYQALGFVLGAFGGGYFLGWGSENEVTQSVQGSFVVVVACIICRLMGATTPEDPTAVLNRVLFQGATNADNLGQGLIFLLGPAQKLSQILFFLGMLIMSDKWFGRGVAGRGEGNTQYWLAQGRMIGALAISLYLGAVYGGDVEGLGSLFTTALVYLCLYALDKTTDGHLWSGASVPFLMFACSLTTWRMALFLHQRPEYILGLVDDGAGKRVISAVLAALTSSGATNAVSGAGGDNTSSVVATQAEPLFSTLDKGCFAFTAAAFALVAFVSFTSKQARRDD